MYSWSGIGVPTTKAIIRESARLVNLTLAGRVFFICSAGSYAEGDLWNKIGVSLKICATLNKSQGTG